MWFMICASTGNTRSDRAAALLAGAGRLPGQSRCNCFGLRECIVTVIISRQVQRQSEMKQKTESTPQMQFSQLSRNSTFRSARCYLYATWSLYHTWHGLSPPWGGLNNQTSSSASCIFWQIRGSLKSCLITECVWHMFLYLPKKLCIAIFKNFVNCDLELAQKQKYWHQKYYGIE